jgi:hypothetical protein
MPDLRNELDGIQNVRKLVNSCPEGSSSSLQSRVNPDTSAIRSIYIQWLNELQCLVFAIKMPGTAFQRVQAVQ